jgi:hypothetical protein
MIPQFYDEFGIYTTEEDIEIFIKSLINLGENDDITIYNKCIDTFGQVFAETIDNLLYYYED